MLSLKNAYTQTPPLTILFDNIKGMVYATSPKDTWTFSYLSDGCKLLTGYAASELIDNHIVSFKSLVPNDQYLAANQLIEAAISAKTEFDIEYQLNQRNGNTIWVSERGIPLFDKEGNLEMLQGIIQDISHYKKTLTQLMDAETRYRSIFENAVEGIFQTTAEGRYIAVNPALATIYGFDSADEMMRVLNDIKNQLYVNPNQRDHFVSEMHAKGIVKNFKSLIYKKDKSTIWISENARKVFDHNGKFLHYEGMVEDITEQIEHEKTIKFQATHDPLTHLPNRFMLSDRMQQNIHLSKRNQNHLAIVMLGIDHFKKINDGIGHETGDLILQQLAERLKECVRETDTVARFGGDEFVIILSNLKQLNQYQQSIKRIQTKIAQPFLFNNNSFQITVSIGVSLYPIHGELPNALLKNADIALDEAKKNGRNQLQIFDSKLNDALIKRIQIEQDLKVAIAKKEFILHYQPKVDFKSGRIVGAEALIRWQKNNGQMVPPLDFIEVAETSGLIIQIGSWVLEEACRQTVEWNQRIDEPLSIAINVSHVQFKSEGFLDSLASALRITGINPQQVQLEITESLASHDVLGFIEELHMIKKLGVKLAMDDFGTGYSSLSYLKDFPLDCLKIDRAFVSKLETETNNAAILNAIVVLAKSLSMEVVAEGVETNYQQAYLKSLQCNSYQGYLFSKPLPAAEFEVLFNQHTSAQGKLISDQ
jgi:diguanylate cyclase (GGDEF)-like protein/PAS domain S-box-containing protein